VIINRPNGHKPPPSPGQKTPDRKPVPWVQPTLGQKTSYDTNFKLGKNVYKTYLKTLTTRLRVTK